MFGFKKNQQYAQLSSGERSVQENGTFLHRGFIAGMLMGVLSVACLIVGIVVLIYHGQRPRTENNTSTDCGTTLADFNVNGCVFDVLSYTWMPARCVDNATSEEFHSWLADPKRMFGPWPFFKNVSEPTTLGENRITSEPDFGKRLNMDIWSSLEEHLAHCLFMFLHVSRVAIGEASLWTADSYPHAEHCFHAIWKGLNGTWNLADEKQAKQKIEIGVASC